MGRFKDVIDSYWLPTAIWAFVLVYFVWAALLTRSAYSGTDIARTEIVIADSTAERQLVTSGMIRQWLAQDNIATNGQPLNDVDLQGIERGLVKRGFVRQATAYATLDGVLHIEVFQRRPLLRLLTDGYDCYVAADGFVFNTEAAASPIYVPVVTGSFRPQFSPGYEGYGSSWCDSLVDGREGIMHKIGELRHRKAKAEARRRDFNKRANGLERQLRQNPDPDTEMSLARHLDSVNRYRQEEARIDREIESERRRIKKTRKEYEDFSKLLNFVEQLEGDGFWRSEIVQIVANRHESGALTLDLIPRSGNFVIEFGEADNVQSKFAKMRTFYNEELTNRGWDNYSVVSVAYSGQVVCKRRR